MRFATRILQLKNVRFFYIKNLILLFFIRKIAGLDI